MSEKRSVIVNTLDGTRSITRTDLEFDPEILLRSVGELESWIAIHNKESGYGLAYRWGCILSGPKINQTLIHVYFSAGYHLAGEDISDYTLLKFNSELEIIMNETSAELAKTHKSGPVQGIITPIPEHMEPELIAYVETLSLNF